MLIQYDCKKMDKLSLEMTNTEATKTGIAEILG